MYLNRRDDGERGRRIRRSCRRLKGEKNVGAVAGEAIRGGIECLSGVASVVVTVSPVSED